MEIVKKVVPEGLFVPFRFIEGYDGRSAMVWVLQHGKLARRRVQVRERLLDGRVGIPSDLQGQVVIDERTDLREGRAARARSGS